MLIFGNLLSNFVPISRGLSQEKSKNLKKITTVANGVQIKNNSY
jgi:hypothetical protein